MNCIDRLIQYLCGKKKVNDNKNDNKDYIDESTYDFLNKKKGDYQDCVICLEPMNYDDKLTVIICSHIFHKECLNDWKKKKTICPLCDYEF